MSRLSAKETFEGLLFQSWMRQRMLVALAVHGPMRIQDAVDLSLGRYPCNDDSFEASGLVVRFGSERSRMIALNTAYPALSELQTLLRALADTSLGSPRLPISDADPRVGAVKHDHSNLFGYKFQTLTLVLTSLEGSVLLSDLRGFLRKQAAAPTHVNAAIAALKRRKLLDVVEDRITFHKEFAAKQELIAFVTAFTSQLPDYPFTVPPKDRAKAKRPEERYDWKKGPVGREHPAGVQASSDRIPLLFGSVVRIRVLVALATFEQMTPTTLMINTGCDRATYATLLDEGLLTSGSKIEGRQRTACAINPGMPAYTELVALAKILATRWPPTGSSPATALSTHLEPRTWKPGLQRYFGSPARTAALLTLSAIGPANVSTLRAAIKMHDRHEVERSLLMFRNYGILRYVNEKEKRKRFELNPDWFAAKELAALLAALRKLDTRLHFRELSKSISDEELLSG
jgi:hypothetical protein